MMRTAMLAMTVVTAVLGQAPSVPPKPMPVDVGPGRVAWFDITTTDLPKSRDFYGTLFGWTFTPVAGTDQAIEIIASGTAIGTLRGAEGPIGAFNGVAYVQVADVREGCRRATALGGRVVEGFPFDLPDGRGAIGLVLDPAGHPIGLYSRGSQASTTPSDRPSFEVRSMEACRVYLTGAGRRAAFQEAALYEVVAGASGAVTHVKPLEVSSAFDTFVQVQAFRACVERWTFTGPGTAVVAFSAGTSGTLLEAWRVSVSADGETTTLVLPLGKN
jgi:predicted enzyme related to lactoylglutathione lyase